MNWFGDVDKQVKSRSITVDGLSTHFFEAGDGPPVVLLHSGEFGACAEASWRYIIGPIAAGGYRVVAPDWLGFGQSDKVIDFADPTGRRLRHMAATIKHLGIDQPALVGNSMGAGLIARDLAKTTPLLSASVAVLTSGGGFVPDNTARRLTLDYDLTVDGMKRILSTMMHRQDLANDAEYVRWRHELSLEPGSWQCTASARLRPPVPEADMPEVASNFGKPDTAAYEQITVPTLVIAGANDPLRLPGYAEELAERILDSELLVYEDCGHMPNLEHPDRYSIDVLSFLDRRYCPLAIPPFGSVQGADSADA